MRFHSLLLCTLFCIATGRDSLAARPKDRDDRGCATYNILDFGAKNDGTTDCAPAFEKIFRRMEGKRQVEIVLPAGSFRISRRIVFDQPQFGGYDYHSGICVRGAGEDATELICDNEDGGLYFNLATNMLTVTVCDLSLVAVKKGLGTAVEFNTADQNPGDHHSRMFQARNLLVRGPHFSNGYFANGIVVKNAWYPMLDNVKITSEYGDSHGKMAAGFALLDCYSPLVDKCYFWGGAEYGLLYRSEIDSEDGIVSDCYFVGQDTGIRVRLSARTDGWGEPAFHLTDSHIHYKVKGLALKGIRQGFVSGNLFYCFNRAASRWHADPDSVSSYTSKDIECDAVNDFIVSHNQFAEPASPKRVCIDILPNSGNLLIDGNIFNMDDTAIRNRSQVSSRCIGNVYTGSPDFTKSADGANALIRYVDPNGTLKTLDFE